MQKRNFVRKKIKSLTLGEKLCQLREDRRMRVQDLSRKINVKIVYIEALEHGRYDELPTKVYTKGFVRSYARFFGVSEDVLLTLFEREYSVHQNIHHTDDEETVSRLPKVPRFVFTPRVIVAMGSFILLCSVGLYLYFSIDSFLSSPWLTIDAPVHNSVTESDSTVVEGKTRSNSHVFINGQQIFVNMDGTFSDVVGLAPGVNIINVKSINKFNKESVEEVVINAEYEVQEEQKDRKNIHIIVRVQNNPVWINVIADGVDIYNDTLQLDDEKAFDAIENITMTSSSGIDTLVSSDAGETFDPISDEAGVVRDWVYTNDEESKISEGDEE